MCVVCEREQYPGKRILKPSEDVRRTYFGILSLTKRRILIGREGQGSRGWTVRSKQEQSQLQNRRIGTRRP